MRAARDHVADRLRRGGGADRALRGGDGRPPASGQERVGARRLVFRAGGVLRHALRALHRRDPGDRLRRSDSRPLPVRAHALERPRGDPGARRAPDPTRPFGPRPRDLRGRPPGAAQHQRPGPGALGRVRRLLRRCASRAAPLLGVPAPLRGAVGPAPRGARGRLCPGAAGDGRAAVIGEIPLSDVLLASGALFLVGLAGTLLRRSAISIFLSIEVMMNAANLALIGYGGALATREGQIVVFFVIAIAAAEASVGLAIFVAVFRHKETIDVNKINLLKW